MASSADDDLFDQIDDLLDFPDESGNNCETDFLCGDFPSIWTQSDAFTGLEPDLTMNHSHSNSDHSAELSVPYEEIAQLEWLSTFVEDSFSAGNSLTVDVPNTTAVSRFHMSSPVSVLESSTSNYAGAKFLPAKPLAPHPTGRCGRPRSDRPRPPTSMQSFTKGSLPCEGQSFGELGSSSLKIRKSVSSTEKKKRKKKKKKIKLYVPAEVDQNDTPNPLSPLLAVRKCQHCEITKTPQWRAGPTGPKTLCNACGVRFKSGRLFPEYRPAASPTFVPSMHSNSHKKVLEMRVKTCNWTGSPLIEDCLCNTQIELIPNKNPVVDYI